MYKKLKSISMNQKVIETRLARLEKHEDTDDSYKFIQNMKVVAIDNQKIDDIVKSSLNYENKPKQDRITWSSKYKLESLSLPQYVQSKTLTKKFKIHITYIDEHQVKRSKAIFFGVGDQFVFNRNINLRLKKLQTSKYTKNRGDLLSAQYWQTVLLQTGQNFANNVKDVITNHLDYVWKKATAGNKERKDYTQIVRKRNETMNKRKQKDYENVLNI